MNPSDILLDEEERGQKQGGMVVDMPSARRNSDMVLDQEVEQQTTRLTSTLDMALPRNPDKAAEAKGLAERFRMDIDTAAAKQDELARIARQQDITRMVADSPVLARQLSDLNFAELAHDNVENMGAIERTIRGLGPAAMSGLLGASSGVVGMVQAPVDLLAPIMDPLAGTILPENPLRRVSSGLSDYRQSIDASSKAWMPKGESTVERGIYSGVGSLARNMAALPLALAPGGQGAALTGMTAPVFGQEYGQARDKGIAPVQAATYGASQAAIEYATEKIPVSRLIGDLSANTGLGKMLLRQAAAEVPGEQVATVLQDLNEWAVLKPEATFADYLKERPGAAAETLIATLVGVGGQTTIMKGIDSAINRSERKAQQAVEAEYKANTFAQLSDLAKADKVLQREPKSFQAFVKEAAAEGEVTDVYIDGRVLNQMAQDLGVQMDKMPQVIQDQLENAVLTGNDVVIPVDVYAAEIAPTEYAQPLLDHLKFNPRDMSKAEATVFMQERAQELQDEVDVVMAQSQNAEVYQASAEAVKGYFAQQLDATGRFRPEVNAAYSTLLSNFYAVTAAKLSLTPEQLLQKYPIQIQAEGVGKPVGGTLMNQDGQSVSQGEPAIPSGELADSLPGTDGSNVTDPAIMPAENVGQTVDPINEQAAINTPRRDFLEQFGAMRILNKDQKNPRAQIAIGADITQTQSVITLFKTADLSSLLHEAGHFFLEVQIDMAVRIAQGAQTFGADTNNEQEQRLLEDTNGLMKWFGLESIDQWYNLRPDQRESYHEKFARGFEAYLFEGNAPGVEIQSLFQRFRSWMISIYRDIKALNVELNDEVRSVMDRMLATEEQIEIAKAARSMRPLFESAQQAGMSEQEFAAYQELGSYSTETAIEKLQASALRDMAYTRNARGREIKKLQKAAAVERSNLRIEVAKDVMSRPIYQAWQWLTGAAQEGQEAGSNKLFLNPANPEISPADAESLKKRRMVSKNGMEPDLAVDMIPGLNGQFKTGGELVRALVAAEPPNQVIEAMVDKAMLELRGELATPEAIEQAADRAIYNDARARFIASELNAIRQATGKPKILNAAARDFATRMIDSLQIGNIKPHLYSNAEAKAARASAKAFKAGDIEAAGIEKRNQLVNAYAAKISADALNEVQRDLKFFRSVAKFGNKKLVTKGVDPDVANVAKFLLAQYGIGESGGERAANYLEILKTNNPEMYAILQPTIEAGLLGAKPMDEMTMEEFRGLTDEIGAIMHLAKNSRMMEVGGNLLDRQDIVDELDARLEEIGVPDQIPGEASAITPMESAGQKLQYAGALLRRVEQWAEAKDGKFGGPFLRFLFQPVKEAADRYRADRAVTRRAYLDLIKTIAPSMKAGVIDAPELGYTFGRGHNGVGMAELLHAVLHTGNDSNKRKLLLGRGWAKDLGEGQMDTTQWDAFMDRMHRTGVIGKQHYDFAQGVWNLLDSMKPLAQKAHRDVFGRYFEEVTANEFSTPFGVYQGGYVPAQADPRIVKDASLRELSEQENQNMAYSFPTTSKGFTKSRVEYNRPLKLDLRSLTQHIDKVLLFAHMEPVVRNVNRVITDKSLSTKLARVDPAAIDGMLVPWIKRAASQQVETPIVGDGSLSRILSTIRSRSGMALMFGNISNTIQQITGLPGAAVKVKPSLLMKATANYMASPRKMAKQVSEASIFMQNRMENEISAIQNQMSDILLDPSLYERGQAWTMKHGYFLQSAMDNVVGPIVWTGAYNQAIEEGQSNDDAVRFADGVIRQTQGSTLPEDVSRIETGPAYGRLFTQFIGYFNMLANTNATELKKVADGVGLRKGAGRALGIVFFGMLAPAWIAEAIAIAMRGGPGDDDDDGWYLDDWLSEVLLLGSAKFALAGIPFVGQFANAGISRFNGNPMDDRVSLSPGVSLLEGSVGAPYSVYQALVNDGNKARAVKDVGTAVSIMTGLPLYWAARPLSYLVGVQDGRIEPTGVVDFSRGMLTGTASPESKE
ncbi:MAG TPA: hypothetical protein DCY64_22545 [Hydrogenophaga sp.]|uniref:hypothetical protein n=1 Tax=Hydrogenophaga sp. TaxID=1904254 RepID=UPI0008C70A5C|nr:hypothetical protein [Hydrogenophaga sp.]OGA78765.1 MAG: hypothetical protein A2X73_07385 [Burkholderiales bacterium GWE1_65_30]OGA89336.1 MAG: hypothetical protein A2X72_16545 [Burkholderiales bacterium GWF1_66_17]HAX23052.1 hypothetical protein [Hydrogenophaga sp.]HBU17084.1 hypothetical protein [Hydrogenophaga sp.]